MKNLAKILCMLLCICISLSMLSGCVNSPDADPETETETQTETQTETEMTTESDAQSETESETETETETDPFADFTVTEGELYGYTEMIKGSSDTMSLKENRYVIIRGNKISDEELEKTALKLYKLALDETGVLLSPKTDFAAPSDYEIILGQTTREENVDISDLTYMDYGWKVMGTKIVIYGGSADAISAAVEKFVSTYKNMTDLDISVPKDAEFIANYNYPYSDITVVGESIKDAQIFAGPNCESFAVQVQSHIGRLTGKTLDIEKISSINEAPDENAILVGVELTDSLEASYKVNGKVLSFVGNHHTGELNPIDIAIDKFFEEKFPTVAEATTANIDASATASYAVQIKNMDYISDSYLADLDAEFEERIEEIRNTPSITPNTSGTTYYVSPNGDDNNDGLTPETAWKTIGKVSRTIVIKSGDTVLFERGGEWNREGTLAGREGVTYSAYGEGPKPIFSHYFTGNEASDWTEVHDNVWVYSGEHNSADTFKSLYPNDEDLAGSYLVSSNVPAGSSDDDVGNIILTKGDKLGWAARIFTHNKGTQPYGSTVNIGDVPLGDFGMLQHNSVSFTSFRDLDQEYTFWHDNEHSRLYMYCSFGNPAEYFDDIKIVTHATLAGLANNSVIDNIHFAFAGAHGVSTGSVKNATVQNCEFSFIGGSVQSYSIFGRTHATRYGNAIQNWADCDGFTIKNNYIHDTYDAATTSQTSDPGNNGCLVKDFYIIDNVMERNVYDIELFISNVTPAQFSSGKYGYFNLKINGNLMRQTGKGFGSTRFDKAETVMKDSTHVIISGCEFDDNKIWDTACRIFRTTNFNVEKGYSSKGNLFVMEYGVYMGMLQDMAVPYTSRDQTMVDYYYTSEVITEFIEKGVLDSDSTYGFTITE